MKSFMAALRSLVLPFGASTGPRIVLDGVNGRIQVFDNSGTQIGILDGVTGFKFSGNAETFLVRPDGNVFVTAVPDMGAYIQLATAAGFGGLVFFQPEDSTVAGVNFNPAAIYADTIEVPAVSSQPKLQIASPDVTGTPDLAQARIALVGQKSNSVTDDSSVDIDAGSLRLTGSTRFGRPNVIVGFSQSIPTGVVTQLVNASFTLIENTWNLYNNGLFVVDRDGDWEVGITGRYQAQNPVAGQRQVRMQVNGVDYYEQMEAPTTGGNSTLVTCGFTIRDKFFAGDIIGFQAFQTSGGNLTLGNGARALMELIDDT